MLVAPLSASAQTAAPPSDAALVAALTQLVQLLEQELQQLIAQHAAQGAPSTSTSVPLTVTETPGALSVAPTTAVPPTPPTNSSGSLTASPTSGPAPLTVSFSWNAAAVGANGSIDFGDGQHGNWLDGIPSGMNHTYASAGTYTASLANPAIPFGCPPGLLCDAPASPTATITVTGNDIPPGTLSAPQASSPQSPGSCPAYPKPICAPRQVLACPEQISELFINSPNLCSGPCTCVLPQNSATVTPSQVSGY
jgi:PKD domain